MMSCVLTAMALLSFCYGAASGRLEAVSAAALEGATSAISLTISLAGPLCLWSGLLAAAEESGLIRQLCRLFRPLLKHLFPGAARDPETLSALSENVSANLLGLGNAATPPGIRAVQRMAQDSGGCAGEELCRLVVLNTASIQLLPTTVASLRAVHGCRTPFDLLPAVWLSSLASVIVGLLAVRLFAGKRTRS